jgi:GTP cyclohydrolase III
MYLSQVMAYLIADPQAIAKYDVLNLFTYFSLYVTIANGLKVLNSNQLITKITNPQIPTKLYKYLQQEKHHENNL